MTPGFKDVKYGRVGVGRHILLIFCFPSAHTQSIIPWHLDILLSLDRFNDNPLRFVEYFRLGSRFDHMKYKTLVKGKLIQGRF